MNERIFELAKQCYEYKAEMLDIWFNKEKFVELLLKECMDVALYGDEFEQAKANIKQHFGVEE